MLGSRDVVGGVVAGRFARGGGSGLGGLFGPGGSEYALLIDLGSIDEEEKIERNASKR